MSQLRRQKREKVKKRIHKKITGTTDKPRLAVFRGLKSITAQIIDDTNNKTLVSVSSLSKDLKVDVEKAKGKVGAATVVGKAIAEKAKSMKIEQVVFDRGGYLYHGRVKALAEGAREAGLKF
jgi:large subunit ribosomal protein L18